MHKEPIIERVPNLKSLIEFAIRENVEVIVITTKNRIYPTPFFKLNNIKLYSVNEKKYWFGIPTFLKFSLLCVLVLAVNFKGKYSLILAGRGALCFGYIFKIKNYSSFIVEYPEIYKDYELLGLFDQFEINAIKRSSLLICHDNLHIDLIKKELNIAEIPSATIPNGTLKFNSDLVDNKFLHRRLNLAENDKLILHSGGFGPWFDCSELANQSGNLPAGMKLIFHTSHNITNDSYYKNYLLNKNEQDKSLFSLAPVSIEELDNLVASSFIGIAWYNKEVLGFRAVNLGLAAGKIGNYLKCGIPVIAPKFSSFDYIETYDCGVLINDLTEFSEAVEYINLNHDVLAVNAKVCYKDLWLVEPHVRNLLSILG